MKGYDKKTWLVTTKGTLSRPVGYVSGSPA